jgi:hypothetical protein
MPVSLYGLLELVSSFFPSYDRSSIPEIGGIMTCFITLSRGALLFPQMPLVMLHNWGHESHPYDLAYGAQY